MTRPRPPVLAAIRLVRRSFGEARASPREKRFDGRPEAVCSGSLPRIPPMTTISAVRARCAWRDPPIGSPSQSKRDAHSKHRAPDKEHKAPRASPSSALRCLTSSHGQARESQRRLPHTTLRRSRTHRFPPGPAPPPRACQKRMEPATNAIVSKLPDLRGPATVARVIS